jgi:hypothetical protein
VRERLDDTDLLLVALRQPADRPVEVEPEPLRERRDAVGAAAAAQPGEVVQQLPSRAAAVGNDELTR